MLKSSASSQHDCVFILLKSVCKKETHQTRTQRHDFRLDGDDAFGRLSVTYFWGNFRQPNQSPNTECV